MAKFDFRKVARRAGGIPMEFQVGVADGAASGVNIAVTGIKRADGLISVLRFKSPNDPVQKAISEDLVSTTTIPADGFVLVGGTVDTTGNQLLVFWYKFAI